MRCGRARRRLAFDSDDELIGRVRAGDDVAFGELYRRHRTAAQMTARWTLRARRDVDDAVADAFAGVLAAIRNGNGPRENFRSYLLAAVRNGCRMRLQRRSAADRAMGARTNVSTTADPERYVEADTVARAFARLRPRWRHTLWLAEVEQRTPAEIAERLSLAPNAAAALMHRAREAFATAYLAEHVEIASGAACQRFVPRLAAYVRGQLTDAQREQVAAHIADCDRCQRAVDELSDLNASLRTLGPLAGAAGLNAPLALGTSVGMASTGLFGSGLLLKGAAAILVAAPLVVLQLGGGRGGQGTVDERDPMTVVSVPPTGRRGDDARAEAPAAGAMRAPTGFPKVAPSTMAGTVPEGPPPEAEAALQAPTTAAATTSVPAPRPASNPIDVVSPIVEPVIEVVDGLTPARVGVVVGGTTPDGSPAVIAADVDTGLADVGVEVAGDGITADLATSPISAPLVTVLHVEASIEVSDGSIAATVSTPEISTPLVTLPALEVEVSRPVPTVPQVTVPEVTGPELTVPEMTLLDVNAPELTVPGILPP